MGLKLARARWAGAALAGMARAGGAAGGAAAVGFCTCARGEDGVWGSAHL